MIHVVRSLFERRSRESDVSQQHSLRLAAAALLVETARADFTQDASELDRLAALLATSLQLGQDEIHELVVAAQQTVETATSLYEFTRVINAHCTEEHKLQLLRAMSPEQFGRAYFHPESGETVLLAGALAHYAWHGRHHTGQIAWLRGQKGW